MTYDDNNIFAKILRGEAPAARVYEDEHSLAFMDVMPQVDGHTLVIPKTAAEDIFTLEGSSLAHTILTVKHVATAVKAAFAAPGVMIAQLNGAAAGQSVFHLHFHILPRHAGLELRFHAREMADAELLASHAERIRAEL